MQPLTCQPSELLLLRPTTVPRYGGCDPPFGEGARSSAAFRSYLARHLPPRPGGIDVIEELWPRFWQACLTAFIECDDGEVRRHLQTAFPNEDGCYPPEFAGLLEQARRTLVAPEPAVQDQVAQLLRDWV